MTFFDLPALGDQIDVSEIGQSLTISQLASLAGNLTVHFHFDS